MLCVPPYSTYDRHISNSITQHRLGNIWPSQKVQDLGLKLLHLIRQGIAAWCRVGCLRVKSLIFKECRPQTPNCCSLQQSALLYRAIYEPTAWSGWTA